MFPFSLHIKHLRLNFHKDISDEELAKLEKEKLDSESETQ